MDSRNFSSSCGRQEDLVTYLYDEATDSERKSFELHLNACDGCSGELKAFGRVRENLGAWDLAAITSPPRMELTVRRNAFESLTDTLRAWWTMPSWVRVVGVAATAAVAMVVAFSFAGTRIDLRAGTLTFGGLGMAPAVTPAASIDGPEVDGRAPGQVANESLRLTRSEIETMIAERVAMAAAEDKKQLAEMKVQVATLSGQLANSAQSQTRMAASLASLRTEQRALAARGQSTLGEWLFASNGPRESWGGDDEKDN